MVVMMMFPCGGGMVIALLGGMDEKPAWTLWVENCICMHCFYALTRDCTIICVLDRPWTCFCCYYIVDIVLLLITDATQHKF